VLHRLASSAGRLSDVDLLTGPFDMSVPIAGPCSRVHKTTALPYKQLHPGCNALVLAATADWVLQQEQSGLGLSSSSSSSSSVTRGRGQVATSEWAVGFAVRGGDGASLVAALTEVDEQLSVGQFGAEPSNSSYTAELSVAQAVGEAHLQAQLRQQQQQRCASTAAAVAVDGSCQMPLSKLSWLANVLLLSGPASYCLSGGSAAAADRLSALAAVCRAEAARQQQLQHLPSRAARRAPVFEHYLCRKVPGLGSQGGLLEVLQRMFAAA
jgi:hypothetical protein